MPHLFRTILQWCGVRARRPYRTTVAKCHCDQPRKRCRPCYRTSCEDAAVRPWKCVNCPLPPPPLANQRQFHHWQQQCPQQQCRRRRGSVAMQPQVSHSMPCKVYWYDPLSSLSIHTIGTLAGCCSVYACCTGMHWFFYRKHHRTLMTHRRDTDDSSQYTSVVKHTLPTTVFKKLSLSFFFLSL